MKNKTILIVTLGIILSMVTMGCSAKSENQTEDQMEVSIESQDNDTTEEETEAADSEAETEEATSNSSKAIIYITLDNGATYTETTVDVEGELTAEFLINQMSELTGWNLDLADEVTSGKGGMTVSFAKTSSLYVGPPEPQVEQYYIFDSVQMCASVLDSIQHTLQQNFVDTAVGGDPESLDIYYCAEEDTELYLANIGGTVSMTEPYTEIEYSQLEVTAKLYYPDDELLETLEADYYTTIISEQELYDSWEEMAKLDTGTQVLGFDGKTLDLSEEFAVLISGFGSSGEVMYIEGLARTFKEFYDISELYLTIDGEIFESGHAIYDFAL